MHQGLNIGLGAWIAQQAGLKTLPVLPKVAIPFYPQHLGTITTTEEKLRAEELAHLANRMVGIGCEYGSDALPQQLWDVHKALWSRLDIAVSTLNSAERTALAAADSVLLAEDGTPSQRYQLYLEYRRLHEDLVLQAADPAAVNFAFSEWLTFGHKHAVEEALATKTRLSRNTSAITAQHDIQQIEMALMAGGGETPFVPTFFSPLSASATEHWMEAEVDFQALEDTLPPEAPWGLWRQFRANKTGSVRLKYIVLDLLRPWLNTDLYAARDWRLPQGETEIVADGNGRAGQLPAYLSKIYLAQVLEVRPQVAPVPTYLVFQPLPVVVHTATFAGVVKPRLNAMSRALSTVTAAPLAVSSIRPATLSKSAWVKVKLGEGVLTQGVTGKLARINKLNAVAAIGRLHLAEQLLNPQFVPLPTPPPASTYIVGFGRTHLPYCPNPNSQFQWSQA